MGVQTMLSTAGEDDEVLPLRSSPPPATLTRMGSRSLLARAVSQLCAGRTDEATDRAIEAAAGSHGVAPDSLCALVRLLGRISSAELPPELSPIIFDTLMDMAVNEDPTSYFRMSPGGIRLSGAVTKWPPNGFTFACWLRPTISDTTPQIVFCLASTCGATMAALLGADGNVVIRASSSSGTVISAKTVVPAVATNHWTFLTIRFSRSRTALLTRRSRLEVYVNQIAALDQEFDFPKMLSLFAGSIGCLCESVYLDANPFSGWMSGIYLFNDRVTSCTMLTSIFRMGIDYRVPVLSQSLRENIFVKFSNSFSGKTDDLLMSCFVFAFHPLATEGNLCIDTSPVASETGATLGELYLNTEKCDFPRLGDVLCSRFFLLIPAFDNLDALTVPGFDVHAAIIRLFHKIVARGPFPNTLLELSSTASLFAIIGNLLMRSNVSHVSTHSADAYQQLLLLLWDHSERMPSILVALCDHILRIDWWARPGIDPGVAMHMAELCRTIFLSQRPESLDDIAPLSIIDRLGSHIPGTDNTSMRIRHRLFTSLAAVCESDFEQVCALLDSCAASIHAAQFIELLVELITDATDLALMTKALDAVVSAVMQHALVHTVLVAALHCLNVLLALRRLEIPDAILTGIILPQLRELSLRDSDPLLLGDIVNRSFLELFLVNCPPGRIGVPNIIAWLCEDGDTEPRDATLLPSLGAATQEYLISHVPTLFAVIKDVPNRRAFLAHISVLVAQADNCDIVLKHDASVWQQPLLSLVVWNGNGPVDAFGDNQMILDIMRSLFAHAIWFRRDATDLLRACLARLQISAAQTSPALVRLFVRELLHRSLERVDADASTATMTPDLKRSRNFCALGDFLEEVTWGLRAGPLTPIRRRRSSCSDTAVPSQEVNVSGAPGNDAENWILCYDDPDEQMTRPDPMLIIDVLADLAHIELLIIVVVKYRMELYVPEPADPHRLNLMRVLLLYLSEAIGASLNAFDDVALARRTAFAVDLVTLAATGATALPGTNFAVVLFLQRLCSLQIAACGIQSPLPKLLTCTKLIANLMADVVRIFCPFIAVHARHSDDPKIMQLLQNTLGKCRFGELQTRYVHDSPASASTMILPPFTGLVFCIPVDIAKETHTFTVHPHTAFVITDNKVPVDTVEAFMLQCLFPALNEMVQCEQSARSSRFADYALDRYRLEAMVLSADLVTTAGSGPDAQLQFAATLTTSSLSRARQSADGEARRRAAWLVNEKYAFDATELAWERLSSALLLADIAWSGAHSTELFWTAANVDNIYGRLVLELFLSGNAHSDSTHSVLLASARNESVAVKNEEEGIKLGSSLAVANPPSKEVEWDLCEVVDDDAIVEAELSPRRAGVVIECVLITPIINIRGTLLIEPKSLTFSNVMLDGSTPEDSLSPNAFRCDTLERARSLAKRTRSWSMERLCSVRRRRYQLQHSAVELFFDGQECVFFDFNTPADQNYVVREILQRKPPQLDAAFNGTPRNVLHKAALTRQWQRREISNFDYLMGLNVISGRTFQDVNQYPIFPWILSDYSSSTINLNDVSVYRDLSRPVGAQTDAQTAVLAERYEHFLGTSIPPFHFGSHYSNAAVVTFFLLRLEPFASLHIELQDGRFDFPDRLFSSMEQTWRVCTTSRSSVKELVPEFFALPEAFVNCNGFDLGVRQNGTVVGDVALPPWAHNSADRFIRIQREALESEYVSANLPSWIDLIWGFKQRGEAAVKAFNVFFHLSYEGAVDLDSVLDPLERSAMRSQIGQWGQTPTQLFNRPHVQREPPVIPPERPIVDVPSLPLKMIRLSDGGDLSASIPVCKLIALKDRLMLVSSDHVTNQLSLSHNLSQDRITLHPVGSTSNRVDVMIPTHPNSVPAPECIIWSNSGRYVVTGNHWDSSLRLYRFTLHSGQSGSSNPFLKLASYVLIQALIAHSGRVTCLASTSCQMFLVSGSIDCNIILWSVSFDDGFGKQAQIACAPIRIFSGHEHAIVSAAVSAAVNICVSCSSAPFCYVHRMSTGDLVRRIALPDIGESVPRAVLLSPLGYIVLGCRGPIIEISELAQATIVVCNINGNYMRAVQYTTFADEACFALSHRGGHIATVLQGAICIHRLDDLTVLGKHYYPSARITAVEFSVDDELVLVGSSDGRVFIYRGPI